MKASSIPVWIAFLFGLALGWFAHVLAIQDTRRETSNIHVEPARAADLEALWPLAQNAGDREEMAALISEVHSTSAILAGNPSDPEQTWQLSDAQWEWLKQKNLHEQEEVWTRKSLDAEEQESSFAKWSNAQAYLNPDARARVIDWIRSGDETLDVVVTNEPTSAQYQVQGDRYDDGIDARIEFIGNLNW